MASGLNSARSPRKTNFHSSVPSATALTEQMDSFFSEIKDPRGMLPFYFMFMSVNVSSFA